MADDETRDDELEAQEEAPLPAREMMSLISTDPADPLVGVGGLEPGPNTEGRRHRILGAAHRNNPRERLCVVRDLIRL